MSGIFEVNTKLHYGLILMTELAKAHKSAEALSLEKVAKNSGFISAGYLEEIAAALKRAKLIKSTRGPAGGYQLSQPPQKTTVADTLIALKGPLTMVSCQGEGGQKCPIGQKCRSKKLWGKLQKQIERFLEKTTLADLMS